MTEMIRELMIQSVGAFLAILVFPAGRYAAEISGLCGHYRRCRMAGVPGINAGGNLAGGGGIFSSLAAALLSQVFARVLKAPVTIFLVAGILPTVPGASIYRSVYFLIQGQTKWYNFYLIQTIQIAGAMAVAIFIVDSLFRLLRNKAS